MDRTAAFYSQPSYVQRGGGGLPVYSGSRRQRGGSVLGAIKSFIMPFLGNVKQKAIQRAKQEAWGLAKGVALDAFHGRNIANSLKRRGIHHAKQLGKNVLYDATSAITDPVRRKRKATTTKANRSLRKRRKVVRNF